VVPPADWRRPKSSVAWSTTSLHAPPHPTPQPTPIDGWVPPWPRACVRA